MYLSFMKTIKNKWFALSSDVRALIQTITLIITGLVVIYLVATNLNALIIFTCISFSIFLVIIFKITLEELKEKNRNKDEERKFNDWAKKKHRGH